MERARYTKIRYEVNNVNRRHYFVTIVLQIKPQNNLSSTCTPELALQPYIWHCLPEHNGYLANIARSMLDPAPSTCVYTLEHRRPTFLSIKIQYIMQRLRQADTYDHRTLKTRLPVRSALFKQRTGGLVVRWVTTSEYPLLYVFAGFLQYPLIEMKLIVCCKRV